MRKPIIPFIISVSLFLIACGNETNNQASTATAIDTIAAMTTDTASEKTYDVKINLIKKHQIAQRLLKKVTIINNFAKFFPGDKNLAKFFSPGKF